MIILGIETSTQICSTALIGNDTLLTEYRLNIKNAHAGKLVGAIEKILRDADVKLQELSGIAVSIGPGSFTGLRIGLSVAKGLAMPDSIPLAAVPTLTALASQAPIADGVVCPLVRSRAKEFYSALYRRHQFVDEQLEDVHVLQTDELQSFIPENALLIGDTNALQEQGFDLSDFQTAPEQYSLLSGYTIARLGAALVSQGRTENLDTIEPLYHQDFIAGKPKKSILFAK
ncbi:MAG: tRNA (adenosine(37)-N6)-threonylcarbamoyltransferase complex dimerization subunit type 1 TsaB [Calditrichaeota bacterium]|nr:tRNA (adenosine(37)-N6)-threonylcarbamoyltransferase complex dimerization subunit type 1 TsaB [Calditrichota bacterium]